VICTRESKLRVGGERRGEETHGEDSDEKSAALV
jgi:hypothetical protein